MPENDGQHRFDLHPDLAATLRAMGHTALNPAENPAPPCGSWQAYMRQAITQLVQCQSFVLRPGWADSKGAGLEFDIAMRLGLTMHRFEDVVQKPETLFI